MKFIERIIRALRGKKALQNVSRVAQREDSGESSHNVQTNEVLLSGFELERISPLPQPKKSDTVIGADAVMLGTLRVGGRAIVQGRISGHIIEKENGANVYVDEHAKVRGELKASNALIYGEVEGALTASVISIEQTAKVSAVIEYRDIRIKGGLNGAKLTRNQSLLQLREDKDTQQRLLAG